jgi:hypothetical protein
LRWGDAENLLGGRDAVGRAGRWRLGAAVRVNPGGTRGCNPHAPPGLPTNTNAAEVRASAVRLA